MASIQVSVPNIVQLAAEAQQWRGRYEQLVGERDSLLKKLADRGDEVGALSRRIDDLVSERLVLQARVQELEKENEALRQRLSIVETRDRVLAVLQRFNDFIEVRVLGIVLADLHEAHPDTPLLQLITGYSQLKQVLFASDWQRYRNSVGIPAEVPDKVRGQLRVVAVEKGLSEGEWDLVRTYERKLRRVIAHPLRSSQLSHEEQQLLSETEGEAFRALEDHLAELCAVDGTAVACY